MRPTAVPVTAAPRTPNTLSLTRFPSLRTTVKTTTPRLAPIGSITVLSQRRIGPVGGRGRTRRRIGITTVGPETTNIAPRSTARSEDRSVTRKVVTDPTIQVTTIPRVTSRRIGCRPIESAENLRPIPLSKSSKTGGEGDRREQKVPKDRLGLDKTGDRPSDEPCEQQNQDRRNANPRGEPLPADAKRHDDRQSDENVAFHVENPDESEPNSAYGPEFIGSKERARGAG